MKRFAVLIAVLAMAMAISVTAAAASSSTCQAYNAQLCAVANADGPTASTASTARANSSSGTLPFTGLDVALLAVGGGGLLAIGLVVRRLASHPRA